MLFWAWVVTVITAMMSALYLLPELSPVVPSGALWAFVLLSVLSFVVHRYWHGIGAWGRVLFTLFVLLFGVGLAVWRVYEVHNDYLAHTPKQTIKVTAHARLDHIADSVYDPISTSPYRQKATLYNISTDGAALPKTMTVLLSAYPKQGKKDPLAALSELKVGEQVVMTLKLSPLTLTQNTVGFDSTRWLMTRNIHANAEVVAVGKVMAYDPPFFERQRERFRHIFVRELDANQDQTAAVLLSLLTGDRAFIDQSIKALYQATGISHLLAISGTHVLFLAILLAAMVCFVTDRYCPWLYARMPRWQLRFLFMLVVALCYAWFTGFEVPAVRTVLLLFLFGVARYLLFGVSAYRLLALAAFFMAYADPYVLWQAGFWLSFVAVALLMAYEQQQNTPAWWRILLLQGYIFVAMLPLTLLLFGKVSFWGLIVNVFAVALFGWVIVPLNLLGGVVYGLSPTLASWVWTLALGLLNSLHSTLTLVLDRFGAGYIGANSSVAFVLLFLLALVAWRVRFLPTRLALLPLLVLVLSPFAQSTANQVTALASSQSQVAMVLIQSGGQNHLLLSHMPTRYGINEETLVDELWQQLVKVQATVLHTVVIQNDDPALFALVARLSDKLPTRRLYAPRAGMVGKVSALPCLALGGFEMHGGQTRFVTGWQLDKPSLSTCNVSFVADDPIDVHTQARTQPASHILIDATDDDLLWRLYALLCPAPLRPEVVLTHSQSALDEAALEQLGDAQVIFSNYPKNIREQKAADERLLMLGP